MKAKVINAKKIALKSEISHGDFVILSQVLQINRGTAIKRFERNGVAEILFLEKIVMAKKRLVSKLQKEYQLQNPIIGNKKP